MADELTLDNPHDRGLAPSRLPEKIQWAAIGLFVLALVVSAGFVLFEHWRRAAIMLGGAMVWLAIVRMSCDSQRVGVLAVRSRRFDAAFCAILGGALLFLSLSVDS